MPKPPDCQLKCSILLKSSFYPILFSKKTFFCHIIPDNSFTFSTFANHLLKSIRIYMQEKIIILDFGSQTTQLIGRRLRELNVYCEIVPYNKFPYGDESVKGVILSGSPFSVYDKSAFKVDLSGIRGKYPILGICYGAQFISYSNGGRVEPAGTREYGRAHLGSFDSENVLFKGVRKNTQVWMSHGDTITAIPDNFKIIASTDKVAIAAYQVSGEEMWGVQFHPEVFHSEDGTQMLRNFVVDVCGCSQSWSAASFVDTTVAELKEQLGNDRVILGLSGGVDSSVAAVLLHRAIGKNLTCIFVDHGLLRKNEFKNVMHDYECLGLNVIGVDASEKFFKDLEGVTEPEQKRKIIGRDFIEVFDAEAHKITDARWLAQGTIYPDRIESLNITGKTIKSHHNVGGLPEEMNLRLCEPLQWLFKDEVRRVGRELGMPEHLITRHPFPGPGLAVRILGDITPEKVHTLQEADDIFIQGLRDWKVQDADGNETSLYHQVWQAGVILLPVQSVGVMGDERTYERAVALRAVTSTDAMTADWAHLPYEFLGKVSNDIINKVKGVNRVTYDISSKPPSTIEWE
jgi:GMP synthase (glutamine-hydrolysing)